ncbi:hypothetical protein [Paenibacillus sp. FSL H7-0331]|uniref:hypothetical protein n=1 Tax=Paenibacillus sp. FSL H7-0331 TaxID=1920421 RepID=UPI00096CCB2A|nr:hypothetical protein [Paenibacillus sp. FSL H7-0331]OMF14509.1 hypothetical protein BK127_17450 [Paenibacillus sp. FSL H7-0331]
MTWTELLGYVLVHGKESFYLDEMDKATFLIELDRLFITMLLGEAEQIWLYGGGHMKLNPSLRL